MESDSFKSFSHPVVRYSIALVMVTLAILARLWLSPYVEGRLPFACLMLALVVVATFGGFGPGLLTLVVGTLATMWLFLPPTGTLRVEGLPYQITLYAFSLVGFLIILLGEAFRRAREKSRAYAQLLGVDFKQSGEIFVRTPAGLRQLSKRATADETASLSTDIEQRPLDRIVSEILPAIAETTTVPQWEIRANGKPIMKIELRDKSTGKSGLPKWVVTYVNPVESPAPVVDPY